MNYRQKKKRFLIMVLCFLSLFVGGLSIVYAALSETLTISGSGTVTASNWDVRIEKGLSPVATGSATFTTPTVTGTTIANYSVGLTKPGDSVTFYFLIKNEGSMVAEITSIINGSPSCTSATGNTQDASLVCDNLDISLKYASGYDISVGNIIDTDDKYCLSDNDVATYSASLVLKIKLKDSMTSVPSSKVTISGLNHQIILSQTDKTCVHNSSCFVEGTKVLTESGYKNIEDIVDGEYVYAMNLDTNSLELKQVLQKLDSYSFETFEITVGDKVIEATGKHPFYIVDKGWVQASDLIVGDRLSSMETDNVEITKINRKTFKDEIPVFNMEIEGHHNYLITENNYLVHNAGSNSSN